MVGVYLKPNTAKLLKIHSAVEGIPISEIVEEAIVNLLLNPTRQTATLDDVDRMVARVKEKLTQITGTP